ncbi:TBC1 domain family member 22A isoform X3 [Pteropus alecto]|uniref:TBC1 domain family member 22A isoform X3 n=1 Tax=Pteropus alecto TaxID=9402 RepID=UPI000D538A15|nr:TBC1 domain family member 22A isoform X3 [Pteropus alecto]
MASDGARKQFWKRSNSKVPGSIQHVYGAQHPPFDPLLHGTLHKATPQVPATPLKAKRLSTFQEFESSTSDAWDAGEDGDELLAVAAESLNTEVAMETARRVLRNHSQRQERRQLQEVSAPGQKPQPLAEPALVPSGDLRLVKSVSESHAPCPAESASDPVPLQRSQSLPHPATGALDGTSDPSTLSSSALSEREASRLHKFRQLIAGPNTDLEELRKLSWSGIPKAVRPITWKLLSGYLPANVDRRPATLQRKQKEYFTFIERYYDSRNDEVHQDTYRQIHIDIPRMSPEALLLQPSVTEIFERILFIWAIRHPASGYVQGINDLVTPFFVVFICEHIGTAVLKATKPHGRDGTENTLEPESPGGGRRGRRRRVPCARRRAAQRGGRHVLVREQAAGRHPGQLHLCPARDSDESEDAGRAREPDRRACPPAPGAARGAVPAVRLPLDEQLADEGAATTLRRPPVGHLPAARSPVFGLLLTRRLGGPRV